jgi:hypothetical protein
MKVMLFECQQRHGGSLEVVIFHGRLVYVNSD